MKARVVAVVAALSVALGAAASADATAIYPVATSGSPGPWVQSGFGALGGGFDVQCVGRSDYSSNRLITLYPQKVGRSPATRLPQVVYMQAYTQFSFDGRTWYTGPSHGWKSRRLDSSFSTATFDQETIDVTSWVTYYPVAFWRVRAEFRWFGSTWLGTATTGYTVGHTAGDVPLAGTLAGEFGCALR